MSDPLQLELDQVRKSYGRSFALDIPQLRVSAGEVLGLLGPTGSGKTTLLRILAGLLRADEGRLRLGGLEFDGADLPLTLRRRITLVHQRPVVLSGSVRFNVAYGLRLRGVRDASARTDEVLAALSLEDLADQSAATLSGGQTQLVALARALVVQPDVLLLDEATSHLDPAHVALVERTVERYRQQRQATIVWATHNLFQARRIATRAALLLNGRLVETASSEQFFSAPSDSRTADFVQGRMIY